MINFLVNEAIFLLKNNKNSLLIDVRTPEEWSLGIPYIKKITDTLLVDWLQDRNNNHVFATEIGKKISDKNMHLVFICRSGYRSALAASLMMSSGYRNCYNVIDGIEGTNGWKNNGLPFNN